MTDENSELLKQFQHIIKELVVHAKEDNCQHTISQFLEGLNFENE